jgi:hypothetical protein
MFRSLEHVHPGEIRSRVMTTHPARGESAGMTTCYRITVRGRLGDHFAGAFDGLKLEPQDGRTVLTGKITDQAHLHGVLERLRDLGLELIRLEQDPR